MASSTQHPIRYIPFDRTEALGPLSRLPLAAHHARVRGQRVDVIAERLAVFGLAMDGGDDAFVGGDALHGAFEG
jgi:hypothetical protein